MSRSEIEAMAISPSSPAASSESAASSTIAPAPSPKRMHEFRSSQSTHRESASAPITRHFLPRVVGRERTFYKRREGRPVSARVRARPIGYNQWGDGFTDQSRVPRFCNNGSVDKTVARRRRRILHKLFIVRRDERTTFITSRDH